MSEEKQVNEAAKELSKLGASKGGVARAQKLSPEKRSEIARLAVEARWERAGRKYNEEILRATHQGVLKIGEREMPCAVLNDGTRIISRNAIFRAFGRTKRGRKKDEVRVLNMPSFIDANNLQPFINKELHGELKSIEYQALNGRITTGYNAKILPLICDVYLTARMEGDVLTKTQEPLAIASEILVRSFAKIGIIALVDEATGFQEVREKLALQKILEIYIAKELRPWIKTFPDSYYENLFRLKEWQYKPLSVKRPSVVGKITNNLIYKRLAPGVLQELKKITPRDSKGRARHRYFQRLTDDIGDPKLREHLASVVTLMKASPNWSTFYRLIQRALPQYGETVDMPFADIEIESIEENKFLTG